MQISFGVVADKYGRRLVIFLSLLGCFLEQVWITVVCMCHPLFFHLLLDPPLTDFASAVFFPDTFRIWSILYGSIFLLIGGGSQMVVAMISTVVADVVPISERTSTFYLIYAMNLLISIAVNPLAALLISIDPWLAMWIGNAVLTIGMLSSALIPETLKFRQAADDKRRGEDGSSAAQQRSQLPSKAFPSARELARRAWFSARNDVSHVWRFIFTSKTVVLLLLAYGPFYLIKLTFALDILQYMTRRFNWEWSTVRQCISSK